MIAKKSKDLCQMDKTQQAMMLSLTIAATMKSNKNENNQLKHADKLRKARENFSNTQVPSSHVINKGLNSLECRNCGL